MPQENVDVSLSPLLKDVAEPLSGDGSAGVDVSYDDDFLALKDDVDLLSSANPEGVDYERIIANCRTILGTKSKDLRVATYLALALSRTASYRGIREGILAQKILVEQYWEPMFPPVRRMKARQNAYQFLAERLTASLEGLKPGAGDRAPIEESIAALKAVQSFTMEAMGDQAPVLSGLSRALEDALRRAPKEQKSQAGDAEGPSGDSAPADSSDPSAGTPTAPPSIAPSPPSSQAEEVQSESEALERALAAARFIHEQAPTDPTSYRLSRCVLWDTVVSEPMNQGGQTHFGDPAPHRVTYLNTLFDSGEWKTLLEEAEATFREAPYHFWLDLQRFIVAALGGLGAEYEAARDAVLVETALLIKRINSLPQLTFMGGAPFADAKTKFWLEDTAARVLATESTSTAAAGDEEMVRQFEEAKRLAASDKLPAALKMLQSALKHDAERRTRFHRRLQMAQICMQASRPAIACPILEQLEAEIDSFSLHEWEPDLAMEVWNQLHQCYRLLSTNEDDADQARIRENTRRVFDRICRMDAARALDR